MVDSNYFQVEATYTFAVLARSYGYVEQWLEHDDAGAADINLFTLEVKCGTSSTTVAQGLFTDLPGSYNTLGPVQFIDVDSTGEFYFPYFTSTTSAC